jgi:hypothetical protein
LQTDAEAGDIYFFNFAGAGANVALEVRKIIARKEDLKLVRREGTSTHMYELHMKGKPVMTIEMRTSGWGHPPQLHFIEGKGEGQLYQLIYS